ncbi:hypothetical protein FPOAC2_02322 [Fusarium poae]|uniref:hypothetical protein n=1 Tax=Fusarium poae TaxID=36050 RepID=UPI001CE9543C|nr:hypothetical protein FPOAC1_002234 [Fusarium poae]KAG8676233.1 hypothetical protein FPOAC1_002234 [Fusarium poae]
MDTGIDAMPFWKPKAHHTAKLPAVYRRMMLYRAKALLDRLINVREFAMEFATEDALLHYANALPLPSPDEQEEEDLAKSPEKNDSDENEDVKACEDQLAQHEDAHMQFSEEVAVVDQRDSDASTGTTDVDMEDTEPIWDGAIHGFDWPNIEEPSEYQSASSDDEDEMTDETVQFDPFEAPPSTNTPESNTWLTNSPDAPYSVFFNTFVTFPVAYAGDGQGVLSTGVEYSDAPQGPTSAWLTNDPNALNGAAEAEASSETWSGDGTASLPVDNHLPISQDSFENEDDQSASDSDSSDEITSQAIDDQMEKLRLAPSTLLHPYSWYWPTHFFDEIVTQAEKYEEYVQKKNDLVKNISENRTLSRDGIDNILYEFVHENIVRKPIVNAAQLFKLKRFIDNAVQFVLSTQRNIDAIDADMDEGRRRHFLPLDSPLRLRSKRLGSSLRFVTGVNDAWVRDQDNWGMPPVKKKRKQI